VPVDVIPSGIALDAAEGAATAPRLNPPAFDAPGSAPPGPRATLVAVGHFAAWKGHDRLLRALAIVRARGVDAVLDVLGGDPFGCDASARERLEQQAKALGLSPFVSFRGMVADPRPFLRRATCLVHAAYPEPFGRVIVEAASCRCPVIALPGSHGPAEILQDGVGGCLVRRRDPEALAEAIVALVNDPGLSARLVLGADEKVRRLYDRRVTTRQMERFYASVLEPPRQR
jgi:glycosyltransferase involved in cell wall biosynthesis